MIPAFLQKICLSYSIPENPAQIKAEAGEEK